MGANSVRHILFFLLLIGAAPLQAYTLLDHEQITDSRPRWMRASGIPSAPERDLFYILQWRPDRSMEVRFVNTSTQEMHFNFQFERLQPAKQVSNVRASISAGQAKTFALTISRLDHRSFMAPIRLWIFCKGEDTFKETPHASNRPAELGKEFEPVAVSDNSEQAFFSYPTQDLIGYNPQVLPYFIMRKSADTAEVHFRNLSQHSLHFEFRVLHYQDGMEVKNPRVWLRPREDKEIIVSCARMDDHIPFGLVEVFNIRAGLDSGPYIVSDGAVSERLTKAHDWNFIGSDVFGHDFNPWGLGQLVERANGKIAAVRFRNFGLQPVHFDFSLPQFQNIITDKNPRVTIAAGGETRVPMDLVDKLAGRASVVSALIMNVRIAQDTGVFAGAISDELVPRFSAREGWFFVTPIEDVLRFNPRAIEYQIRPAANGADVAVRNLSDKPLYFDWNISGYQDAKNPGNARVELQPAEERVFKANLTRKDLRIALARLSVSNIRIGKDEGPLLAERK